MKGRISPAQFQGKRKKRIFLLREKERGRKVARKKKKSSVRRAGEVPSEGKKSVLSNGKIQD